MNTEDLILVSVDDHIIEPPDLFVRHISKEYLQRGPQLVRTASGTDVWQFGGRTIENSALNAVAGRPKSEFGLEPQGLDEIRAGCYDVHERVKDMNAGGVLASMNFPSFPGFAARLFATDDHDFSLALVRAYNDWHIDEWRGAYPGRFIPMALPVIWDAQACADEVRRVSLKGCHSLTFTENPAALGYPSFHTDYWDPLWQALCDTNTLQPMNIQSAAADLLFSRVLKRFPAIRIALSEGGTGWIPYFLERVDRVYDLHSTWTLQDFGDKLPSEVFREHFLTCFISDDLGIGLRDRIGVDCMAWECDYPHSDSMWPTAPEELNAQMQRWNVPDDEINKMTHETAMRWFSFDPFAHTSRQQATVGSLRAAAAGHDISVQSRSKRIVAPDQKVEEFRKRARAAIAAGIAS